VTFATDIVSAARHAGINYSFIIDPYESDAWVDGVLTTLKLVLVTAILSVLAGLLLSALLRSRRQWLSIPARTLVELTRNTPTLVQLYCAFLVLNVLINQTLHGAEHNPITPFTWVIIVLSLHVGAFHAEALRAGIEAVPKVTVEAALSLGFSRREILWRIEFPLALRFSLPALTNNFVDLVKLTTLGSAIAVGEVTYASIMIWTQHDNVMELMCLILGLFSLLAYGVSRSGRWLENRLRIPGHDHR
jgi:polar amino acid transport system permease protein